MQDYDCIKTLLNKDLLDHNEDPCCIAIQDLGKDLARIQQNPIVMTLCKTFTRVHILRCPSYVVSVTERGVGLQGCLS